MSDDVSGVPEVVALLEQLNDHIDERAKLAEAFARYKAVDDKIRALHYQLSTKLERIRLRDVDVMQTFYATTVLRLKERLLK